MKSTFLLQVFLLITAIISGTSIARAGNGKGFCQSVLKEAVHMQMMQDTIPKPVKKAETKTPKKEVDVIKSIPVARKQPIPVPVKVKVTPVKITKPKILKPVIKLLP